MKRAEQPPSTSRGTLTIERRMESNVYAREAAEAGLANMRQLTLRLEEVLTVWGSTSTDLRLAPRLYKS
jgi:hypothetical protein